MSIYLKKSELNRLLIVIVCSLLIACTETITRWDPQAYSVMKGDTLYSIAWRYEKDFQQIAEWNNITPPYAIYPGQRLIMQPVSQDGTLTVGERPQVFVESATGREVETITIEPAPVQDKPLQVIVQNDETLYGIAQREGYSHYQLARWNHLRAPYLLRPGQTLRLSPPSNALGQLATTQQDKPAITSSMIQSPVKSSALRPGTAVVNNTELPTQVSQWLWPVKGRVVKTYKQNEPLRKGISIRGKAGQMVTAAAAGTVVYSGNGLINYGNLIIIKHSHAYLSAYAHNKTLLVKEGDSVSPGQAIAKIGSHYSGNPQLHFEIRRNGKPVNPLHYLPKS